MIRSSPWSRYEMYRAHPTFRRRVLLLIPLVLLVAYLGLHFVGLDWSHPQTVDLLQIDHQRWEFYWSPDQVITGLQSDDVPAGQVSNLIQVRWR